MYLKKKENDRYKSYVYDIKTKKCLTGGEFDFVSEVTSKDNILIVRNCENKYGIYDIEKKEYILPTEYDYFYTCREKSILILEKDPDKNVLGNKTYIIYDVAKNNFWNGTDGSNYEFCQKINLNQNVIAFVKRKKGKKIIEFCNFALDKSVTFEGYDYEYLHNSNGGRDIKYLILSKNEENGLFNLDTLKFTIPVEYRRIYAYGEDKQYIIVKDNDEYPSRGLFDLNKEKWIYEPNTEYFYVIKELGNNVKIAKIIDDDYKIGILDYQTKDFILPIEYDRISYFDKTLNNKNILLLEKDEKYGLFDINKKEMIYDVISDKYIKKFDGKTPFDNLIIARNENDCGYDILFDIKTKKNILPDNVFLSERDKKPYNNDKDNIYVYIKINDSYSFNIYNLRTKKFLLPQDLSLRVFPYSEDAPKDKNVFKITKNNQQGLYNIKTKELTISFTNRI